MLITVQTIVDSAINLADMKYSKFIDTADTAGSELMDYANMAYKDLYQQVTLSREPYYLTSATITLVNGTDTYALPADLYKLWGVDLRINTNQNSNRYLTLRNHMFKERNKYNNGFSLPAAPFGQVFSYLMAGNTIQFAPIPAASNTIIVRYSPNPVTISAYSTTLDFPPGGDEYMSLTIAMYMLAKEETDYSQLAQKRQQSLVTITNSFKDRDSGAPGYIVDDSSINAGAWFPFRGGYN